MRKIKNLFIIFLFGLILVNPVLVLAQTNNNSDAGSKTFNNPQYNSSVDKSIAAYLCTPSDPPDGKDLENCINKLYRFGVSFGAIALVFFLVYAGYMYMTGGETGKNSAKGIFQNALIGMVILLSSYVLLGFINPNLLLFKTIQPPIFTADNFPSCTDVGFGEQCVLSDGSIGTGDGKGGGSTPGGIACSEVTKGTKVWVIGDSLAGQNVGTGLNGAFNKIIKPKTGEDIQTKAYGGYSVKTFNNNLLSGISNQIKQANIVFISLGTNDIAPKESAPYATMGTEVKKLLDTIGTGPKIYWIGPPTWPQDGRDTGKSSEVIKSNLTSNATFFDTIPISDQIGNPASRKIESHNINYSTWASKVWSWCGGK